jgi:hypothetical protein
MGVEEKLPMFCRWNYRVRQDVVCWLRQFLGFCLGALDFGHQPKYPIIQFNMNKRN